MVGGLIRHFVDKKNQSEDSEAGSGVLFCSGLIAGEGLVGILLAILTVVKVADKIDLSGYVQTGMIGGVILFVIMIALVVKFATRQKKEV